MKAHHDPATHIPCPTISLPVYPKPIWRANGEIIDEIEFRFERFDRHSDQTRWTSNAASVAIVRTMG